MPYHMQQHLYAACTHARSEHVGTLAGAAMDGEHEVYHARSLAWGMLYFICSGTRCVRCRTLDTYQEGGQFRRCGER